MTFKKGQTINRGAHLSEETKAKIIKDRKAGKKWREIAADLNIPVKRAMTYAKRKWYKEGLKAAPELSQKEKDDAIDVPTGDDEENKGEDSKEDKKKKDKGVVDETKKKAAQNIDQAVNRHIKKTDKGPKSVKKDVDLNKDKGNVDKGAKTGLSERKSINIWFLVAIIIAVVTIGLIFIILRPKGVEKAEYNKPVQKDEDKGGFEGRKISEI